MDADVAARCASHVVDDGAVGVDGLAGVVFGANDDVAPVGAVEAAVKIQVDVAGS